MKITNISTTRIGDKIRLQAHVTGAHSATPFCVFFDFPWQARSFLASYSGNPFLALALLPAMQMGESLEISAPISPRLRESVEDIQSIFMLWKPDLRRTLISAPVYHPRLVDLRRQKRRGLFFSLGVDSFYSLLRHIGPQANFPFTDLLLVHGFDVHLGHKNSDLFPEVFSHVASVAVETGKQIITVETNLREFSDPIISWDWQHGPALASVALCLQSAFDVIYMAGSDPFTCQVPWGSAPIVQPYWSTDELLIRYDGGEADRSQKVKAIAGFPLAMKHLRICWANPDNLYNCGKCEKCVRTMISLFIAGALNQCETLPHEIHIEDVIRIRDRIHPVYFDEIMNGLKELGSKNELAVAIKQALLGEGRGS